jgi:2-amino-4-hydroxy-6-hydroxymethyldihydropteridine diphosphokinase
MKAVIGLGSNMGDKDINIKAALNTLMRVPGVKILRVSSFYETSPVGYKNQDCFINAVAEIESSLSPNALLGACLGIEAAMGRERTIKNGPRIIDIDILICEGFKQESEELSVPHPRISERAFVLVPLRELYSENNAFGFCLATDKVDKNDKVVKIGTFISDTLGGV